MSNEWKLFNPEAVLVFVVVVQVIVAFVQFLTQRQQTRLAVLPHRVDLYDAAMTCARSAADLDSNTRVYGEEPVMRDFNKKFSHFSELLRSYEYLFDKQTRSLLYGIKSDCSKLALEIDDSGLEPWEEHEALGVAKREALERELRSTKLERLAKQVQRHLRIRRFLG